MKIDSVRPKSKQILDAAQALFTQLGYHAVGVDRIKDEAGVTKMTLYKHFPSKEVLIERVLQQRDDFFRSSLGERVAQQHEPWARLRAIFEWHREWFEQPDFNGCMFIKAVEEFPDKHEAIRRISREHKIWVRCMLQDAISRCSVTEPEALAMHLLVVLDGLIVNVNFFRRPDIVDVAWQQVEWLVRSRMKSTGS
jgi:AcrR family transcriptional regulator